MTRVASPSTALPMRTVGERASLAALLNPVGMWASLWQNRGLIWEFAKRDVVARNRGSLLGIVWTLLNPLIMLAVYTFVFAVIWEAKWQAANADGTTASFALILFCGLLCFEVFSASVNTAPTIVVYNPNYVKKVIFPVEVLPVATLVASVMLCAVSVLVLLIASLVIQRSISPTVWAFPLVLVPLVLLAAGISWFVAALGVFLRDSKPVVAVLVQIVFYLTPILYPAEKLEKLPEIAKTVLALNPLASIFVGARETLVLGGLPNWTALAISTLLGLAVMQLGYAFFMKAKRGFPDVL